MRYLSHQSFKGNAVKADEAEEMLDEIKLKNHIIKNLRAQNSNLFKKLSDAVLDQLHFFKNRFQLNFYYTDFQKQESLQNELNKRSLAQKEEDCQNFWFKIISIGNLTQQEDDFKFRLALQSLMEKRSVGQI